MGRSTLFVGRAGDGAKIATVDCLIVSHTHWDREWYRTFQAFRARLVDTVDRVLDLLAADAGWRFLLDGQSVIIEDYLDVRPGRRAELEAACRAGRLAVGPWYVQPDSLLPSGEAHVRNLLEGRRVAETIGAPSHVAYTPDSFGHPAQFPQLFAGFGLGPFVYWRGNGAEIDALGPVYRWVAPDGSGVMAHHLADGYFAASSLPSDTDAAVARLTRLVPRLAGDGDGPVVLMNGMDHTLPDSTTGAVERALAAATGWSVRRGLLDDLDVALDESAPTFTGELVGARVANLLPGTWSARLGLKQRNREAEALLEGWAEPWAALGARLGCPDERPALRRAWRALLQNQAHDSICGCSQDRVHEQMEARYDEAYELAGATTARLLERLAGLGVERRVPWTSELDVAVFNPSPNARTDVVRFELDGFPLYQVQSTGLDVHPFALASLAHQGFVVDGEPARMVAADSPGRVRMLAESPAVDVEFVAHDVPAFGWRRYRLAPGPAVPDEHDDGRDIGWDGGCVRATDDGTLDVELGGRLFTGLMAVEDRGDRGDTYDFDPVVGDTGAALASTRVDRHRHPSGIQRLVVTRVFDVPARLDDTRSARSSETVRLAVVTEARVAPGVEHVDLRIRVDNTAHDHRLRVLLPTGRPAAHFTAATTFDVTARATSPPDDSTWVHPAPPTFPQQGWVAVNGLMVAAPGLYEAEVTPDGTIALTIVRAVGWLARMDLTSRPIPAGPGMPTPGAQSLGPVRARLALLPTADPALARAVELGLRAVPAGVAPVLAPGRSALGLAPGEVVLSALKPAEHGDATVLRVLNPTDDVVDAVIDLGFPVDTVRAVRLDEGPSDDGKWWREGDRLHLTVEPHRLRSLLLE
jgi:hypothetical protein